MDMEEEKKKSRSNLPERCLGQFKDPEIQRKAYEGRMKYYAEQRRKKEAIESGFAQAKISNPDVQAQLLDRLTDMALSDDPQQAKWAMDALIKNGAFRMPNDPVAQADNKKEDMSSEDAISILKNSEK